jgi:hypothetical protein
MEGNVAARFGACVGGQHREEHAFGVVDGAGEDAQAYDVLRASVGEVDVELGLLEQVCVRLDGRIAVEHFDFADFAGGEENQEVSRSGYGLDAGEMDNAHVLQARGPVVSDRAGVTEMVFQGADAVVDSGNRRVGAGLGQLIGVEGLRGFALLIVYLRQAILATGSWARVQAASAYFSPRAVSPVLSAVKLMLFQLWARSVIFFHLGVGDVVEGEAAGLLLDEHDGGFGGVCRQIEILAGGGERGGNGGQRGGVGGLLRGGFQSVKTLRFLAVVKAGLAIPQLDLSVVGAEGVEKSSKSASPATNNPKSPTPISSP